MTDQEPVRWEGARWRPLPEATSQQRIRPTQVTFHTTGAPTPGDPWGYFSGAAIVVESHLWVPMDPSTSVPVQMMDLGRSADANYRANRRPDGTGALSVETQDEGYNARPIREQPWTPYQLERLAAFAAWCNDPDGLAAEYEAAYGEALAPIPLVLPRAWDEPGMGPHNLFPMVWSNVRGKECPGAARTAQVPLVLEMARQMRAPMHYPAAEPQEGPVYVARNSSSSEMRVVAREAGAGDPIAGWDAFLELERLGIVGPPPNPDPHDSDAGNTQGRRWANLSDEAYRALPGV